MAIARGVGLLVAIVAILICIMILMVIRACIAFSLQKIGVTGVITVVGLLVWGALKYGQMSIKPILMFLRHSCN